MRTFYISAILLLLFSGCSDLPLKPPKTAEMKLADLLEGLDNNASRAERRLLAHDIITRAQQLNREFERSTPPKFHNFLVKIGIKERGLCYHFSDGLYAYLKKKGSYYPHFDFHLIGAHIGSYWLEHNALAVTQKGGRVHDGIVVDAWRQTGTVFVSPVREDRAYRWVHRPSRGCM